MLVSITVSAMNPLPLPVQFLGMWRHITSQTQPLTSQTNAESSLELVFILELFYIYISVHLSYIFVENYKRKHYETHILELKQN